MRISAVELSGIITVTLQKQGAKSGSSSLRMTLTEVFFELCGRHSSRSFPSFLPRVGGAAVGVAAAKTR